MARPDTWMPLYIGDYLADTMHLTAEQHGGYLLLIMHYWRSGKPLPANDGQLASIARMRGKEWDANKATLKEFFKVTDKEWAHGRIDTELAAAREGYEKRLERSRKANLAKTVKDTSKEPYKDPLAALNERALEALHKKSLEGTQSQPQPQSPSEKEKPNPNGLGKKPTKGTRLAADWTPDGEDFSFCVEELGWTIQRIRAECAKFRDYWTEQPGSKGIKIRWHGTWRNWCRRAHDDEQRRAPRVASGRGRATQGERRDALLAAEPGAVVDLGDLAGGRGRSGESVARDGDDAVTVRCEVLPDADGPAIRESSAAAERELGDVAGTACEVPTGRSETSLGSRLENAQMGDAAEDRADGGSGGIGPVVSAPSHGQSHAGESHHAAGMGQAGSDADEFPGIPEFLQRHA